MTGFRRWAAILLPFVIAARAILLVFQLRSEHDERAHQDDPPAWPPVAGEELRFRPGDGRASGWGTAATHPQLLVPVTERDYLPPPQADAGCVLDVAALLRHGGTLTVRSALPPQGWRAEWSGGRTVPTRAETADPETDPKLREMDANVLDAADCGDPSRLELTEFQLHVLVAFLSGQAVPPVPDPPPLVRPVHIYVGGPPVPGYPARSGSLGGPGAAADVGPAGAR